MRESCPLCKAERITRRYHEDGTCWAADCSSHPGKKLFVLKRHTAEPTPKERGHIEGVARRLFPGIRLRNPNSIPQHFHLHEI